MVNQLYKIVENRERLVVTCMLLGRCRFHPKRPVGNDQSSRVWPLYKSPINLLIRIILNLITEHTSVVLQKSSRSISQPFRGQYSSYFTYLYHIMTSYHACNLQHYNRFFIRMYPVYGVQWNTPWVRWDTHRKTGKNII